MKYSKLSDFKIKKILRAFCLELTAVQASKQLGLNRKTVDNYYNKLRQKIIEYQEKQQIKFQGNIELDESYFGSRRSGEKRGRGAGGKIPVFGILKRNGTVYTEIVSDASRKSIMPIINRLIEKSKSNIYTDHWRTYDGLVLSGYKHYRINHSKEFARNHNHVNGIESFWSYTKRKMIKHNGVSKKKFYIYLKESEFRFNNRHQDLYKILTKIVFRS